MGRSPALLGTTVYVLAGLFAGALAWSYWTEVDVVVRAPGVVRPEGEVVRITSEVGGMIEAVYVQEGDDVQTGDPLLRLDGQQTRLERELIEQQIALLGVQLVDVDRKIRDAANVHQVEIRKVETETNTARQDLSERQAEHESLLQSAALEVERARADYAVNEQLLDAGLATRQTHDRLETDLSLAQNRYAQLSHRAPRAATLDSLLETKDLIDARFEAQERDLRAQATPIESQLSDLRSRLQQREEDQEKRLIRSPATGQLTLLPILHPGEYLPAGTLIATLAPTPLHTIVEAMVSNRDAADVHPGQPARLIIDDAETFDGIVLSVSPDARFSETAKGAYRVLVVPDTPDLRLGLALEVRFLTRQESVLSLLFTRIKRAFSDYTGS